MEIWCEEERNFFRRELLKLLTAEVFPSKALIRTRVFGKINHMKKHFQKTLVLSSLILSVNALAAIDLPHVDGYDSAATEELWKDVKGDSVPSALLGRSSLDNPRLAYSQLFPKSFLQEELLAVCYQDCKKKDIIKINGSLIQADDKDSLEQANVYFWLKRYFSFIEERFNFRPSKYLRVMTNRSIKDPTAGSKWKNNAFFNPADVTLSFLPASNSWLFNTMKGKINRSGFDPSVIAHEASHYFFHHLFPNPVNSEISGLNEGFADYVANLQLNNPKVGLVMLRGKALRDASLLVDTAGKVKSYEPGMESHALGERIAMVLWQTRSEADNKEEFDRHVVDAVKTISANSYATIHSFKTEMMKRIPSIVSSLKIGNVRTIWEIVIPGNEVSITDTSFLTKSHVTSSYLGFKINQTISKRFADEMGMEVQNNQGFSFIREVKISETQTAMLLASENETITTPYWYVKDKKSGNILGIYGIDRHLVTDPRELKEIESLTKQAASESSTITGFISDTRKFSDLAQGKGDLTSGYKVKSVQTFSDSLLFNGESIVMDRVEVSLKKKLLVSLLVGLPDIEKVTVYTADKNISALPFLNNKRVIGYKLQFSNGTAMEMILNKFANPQD